MKRLSMTIAVMLVGACAGAQDIPAVPARGPAEEPSPPAGSDVAQLAIAALAKDLDIAPEAIQVDTVRAVEWRNSSLGCPKPGVAYLDVITPGHKVTLRADGQVYVVHEAKNRAFVCQTTRQYAGINPKQELVFGRQLLDARKDLASRLGVPESEIKPQAAQERTWDDAGLGCPEAGKTYPPGKVTGWALTFEHGGRDFTYHTDLHRTIPCPAIASE